jgi:pantothenate kinase
MGTTKQFVLLLQLLIFIDISELQYSAVAYKIVVLPHLHHHHLIHGNLPAHRPFGITNSVDPSSKRRHRMSLDNNNNSVSTENESDDTIMLVGSNGNNLRVTWERDVAKDIMQRAHDAKRCAIKGRPDTSNAATSTGNQESTIPVPYMVAIAGIPGSGKSSSAEIITRLINEMAAKSIEGDDTQKKKVDNNHRTSTPICVCIPADGYHYSVKTLLELQVQKNDTTLIYRRGAPDTFDVAALLQDLKRIRYPSLDDHPNVASEEENDSSNFHQVKLPGFDHAIGDPTIHQHIYDRNQHSILIMEGLYLLYDQNQWGEVKDFFDYTIYIQTHSIDTCMERVKERNVCIPGYTVEEIYERVDIVDRNNAILIEQASPARAHQIIKSISSVESKSLSTSL